MIFKSFTATLALHNKGSKLGNLTTDFMQESLLHINGSTVSFQSFRGSMGDLNLDSGCFCKVGHLRLMVCVDWGNHGGAVIKELDAPSFDDALMKIGWKRIESEIHEYEKEGHKTVSVSVIQCAYKKYSIKKAKQIAKK